MAKKESQTRDDLNLTGRAIATTSAEEQEAIQKQDVAEQQEQKKVLEEQFQVTAPVGIGVYPRGYLAKKEEPLVEAQHNMTGIQLMQAHEDYAKLTEQRKDEAQKQAEG